AENQRAAPLKGTALNFVRTCRPSGLGDLDGAYGGLAAALIEFGVEGDVLALDQPADARALKRGRVDEYVLAAVSRLDEAEAPLLVVEFNFALNHEISLSLSVQLRSRPRSGERCLSMFGGSESAPAISKGETAMWSGQKSMPLT